VGDQNVYFVGQAAEPEFRDYQQQVMKNAKALAKALMDRGHTLVSSE